MSSPPGTVGPWGTQFWSLSAVEDGLKGATHFRGPFVGGQTMTAAATVVVVDDDDHLVFWPMTCDG